MGHSAPTLAPITASFGRRQCPARSRRSRTFFGRPLRPGGHSRSAFWYSASWEGRFLRMAVARRRGSRDWWSRWVPPFGHWRFRGRMDRHSAVPVKAKHGETAVAGDIERCVTWLTAPSTKIPPTSWPYAVAEAVFADAKAVDRSSREAQQMSESEAGAHGIARERMRMAPAIGRPRSTQPRGSAGSSSGVDDVERSHFAATAHARPGGSRSSMAIAAQPRERSPSTLRCGNRPHPRVASTSGRACVH